MEKERRATAQQASHPPPHLSPALPTKHDAVPSRFEEPAQVVGYLSAVADALLRTLGWRSLLIHGDPCVLDRWLCLRRALRKGDYRTFDAGCGNGAFGIYAAREFVEDGGLMAYATNYAELYSRAATFVDKIFKGANPADLPIERPTKLELVISAKTAKTIGIEIPVTLLARADEVIE